MPRVNTVKAAKKYKCRHCGTTINKGDQYKWFKRRYDRERNIRCLKPECKPRASQLTSSDKLCRVYEQQEIIEDFKQPQSLEDLNDLHDSLEEIYSELETVMEEYNESADNIEEGFGHETYQSEELQEKAENVENWMQEIDDFKDTIQECIDEWDTNKDERQDILDSVDFSNAGECTI